MDDNKKLLGQRLRELRKRKNLTLAQLSEKINVEPSTLGNIENGYNYPKVTTLENLSIALKCSIKDFFVFEHCQKEECLLDEINTMLQKNPEKIQLVYKMLRGILE